MINKDYCLSSYLAFRYVVDDNMEFAEGLSHQKYQRIPNGDKTLVGSAYETDIAIANVFRMLQNERMGMLLSGGMDSAILASYMPRGADAYTFRFIGGNFQKEEMERAQMYAEYYGLNLHYVDINWNVVEKSLSPVMKKKGAPVHSIEPQIYYAAQQAKNDGVTLMIIGDGADYVFGGMDGLYSKNWSYDEFVARYMYVNPAEVLVNPVSMNPVFEQYRLAPNSIDFIRIMDELTIDESYASYENAFEAAGLAFVDPYAHLKMSKPLDLARIRKGESKYIIRDLFNMKYPDYVVPQKLPMPRPVDAYFANWEGPKRQEFRQDIDMAELTGNQKWLIWCAEQFLINYNLANIQEG